MTKSGVNVLLIPSAYLCFYDHITARHRGQTATARGRRGRQHNRNDWG